MYVPADAVPAPIAAATPTTAAASSSRLNGVFIPLSPLIAAGPGERAAATIYGALREVEVQRVQELDRGVRRVHGDVRRHVEQRLGVVEDDPDAGVDEVVGRLLRVRGRDREHADDDVLLADDGAQVVVRDDRRGAHRAADLLRVVVEDRGDVDAVL